MRIRAKHFWIVAIAGAVGAVLLLYAAWRKPAPISLRIATATRGGTYYPLGVQLAHILRNAQEGPIDVDPVWLTSGSKWL